MPDPNGPPEERDDYEQKRQMLIRATEAAFYDLERAPPARLELSAQEAWMLLVEMQRAWHHARGYGREVLGAVGRSLQERYCPPGTVLGALAAAGWEHEEILPVLTRRWLVPEPFRRSFDSDATGGAGGDPP
jgi:hypothetical protein